MPPKKSGSIVKKKSSTSATNPSKTNKKAKPEEAEATTAAAVDVEVPATSTGSLLAPDPSTVTPTAASPPRGKDSSAADTTLGSARIHNSSLNPDVLAGLSYPSGQQQGKGNFFVVDAHTPVGVGLDGPLANSTMERSHHTQHQIANTGLPNPLSSSPNILHKSTLSSADTRRISGPSLDASGKSSLQSHETASRRGSDAPESLGGTFPGPGASGRGMPAMSPLGGTTGSSPVSVLGSASAIGASLLSPTNQVPPLMSPLAMAQRQHQRQHSITTRSSQGSVLQRDHATVNESTIADYRASAGASALGPEIPSFPYIDPVDYQTVTPGTGVANIEIVGRLLDQMEQILGQCAIVERAVDNLATQEQMIKRGNEFERDTVSTMGNELIEFKEECAALKLQMRGDRVVRTAELNVAIEEGTEKLRQLKAAHDTLDEDLAGLDSQLLIYEQQLRLNDATLAEALKKKQREEKRQAKQLQRGGYIQEDSTIKQSVLTSEDLVNVLTNVPDISSAMDFAHQHDKIPSVSNRAQRQLLTHMATSTPPPEPLESGDETIGASTLMPEVTTHNPLGIPDWKPPPQETLASYLPSIRTHIMNDSRKKVVDPTEEELLDPRNFADENDPDLMMQKIEDSVARLSSQKRHESETQVNSGTWSERLTYGLQALGEAKRKSKLNSLQVHKRDPDEKRDLEGTTDSRRHRTPPPMSSTGGGELPAISGGGGAGGGAATAGKPNVKARTQRSKTAMGMLQGAHGASSGSATTPIGDPLSRSGASGAGPQMNKTSSSSASAGKGDLTVAPSVTPLKGKRQKVGVGVSNMFTVRR